MLNAMSLGNRAHCIQHAWIMLKSLVPHFYHKMHLTCTILRNASSLIYLCFKELGAENRRPNTAGTISVVMIAYCRKIAYPLICLTYLLTSHVDSVHRVPAGDESPPLGTISRNGLCVFPQCSPISSGSSFVVSCHILFGLPLLFFHHIYGAMWPKPIASSLFLPARLYLAVRCAEKCTDWIRAENCGQVQKTNFVIRHRLTRRYLRRLLFSMSRRNAQHKMRPDVTHVAWSVCSCVCDVSGMFVRLVATLYLTLWLFPYRFIWCISEFLGGILKYVI